MYSQQMLLFIDATTADWILHEYAHGEFCYSLARPQKICLFIVINAATTNLFAH
jgi:hypothetical protein